MLFQLLILALSALQQNGALFDFSRSAVCWPHSLTKETLRQQTTQQATVTLLEQSARAHYLWQPTGGGGGGISSAMWSSPDDATKRNEGAHRKGEVG